MYKKIDFYIICSYTILTIIFTYPVAFVGDKIPGFAHQDSGQFLWVLWWFKRALLDLSNPYYTTYIFYPTGVSLAFSTVTPYNAILSIPLQLIFGLIPTYIILLLLSFIIAGYGTYLLVKYMTNDVRASFVSGLIFMFSPYHFSRGMGHLNLVTIQWIPFYILYLYKTVKEENIMNSLYAGFFLLLVALSDYTYLMFMLIFTIIFIIYYHKDILKRNTIKRILVLIISFGATIFPFAYPALREMAVSNYMYYGGFERYSADLIGFFIPSRYHPIFGKFDIIKDYGFFGDSDIIKGYGFFLGYTALLLTFIAVSKIKTKEIRFWLWSAIIFFILTLGPKLHVNGKLLDFPLPYSILTNIPIMSMLRVPFRWDVLVMLSIAVLAGYGLHYLFKNGRLRFRIFNKNENYVAIIISGLIIFEYLTIPFPMADSKIPEFYYQLKNNSEDVSIIEIPAAKNGLIADYMYYQTLHEKKMVEGYVSRRPPYTRAFVNNPFIRQLYGLNGSELKNDSMTDDNITESGKIILNYYNIRYIILHEKYMNKDKADKLLKNISEKIVYKEDKLIVYKIEKAKPESFILFRINFNNQIWMSNNVNNITILSNSIKNRNSKLSIQSRSFYNPRLFQVYLNDNLIHQEYINASLNRLELKIKFKKGENIIRFYSIDS